MARLAVRGTRRGMVKSVLRPGAGGGVAGAALPRVVPRRAGLFVAGLAVGAAGISMVEGDRQPGGRVMTGRALRLVVIGRAVLQVAVLAVQRAGVIEIGRAPGQGGVAKRTLPGVVRRGAQRSMAESAVGGPGYRVIEAGRQPSAGLVTGGALPAVMRGGAPAQMAGLAIHRACLLMVEIGRQPGDACVVAGTALSGVVILWAVALVTGLAIQPRDCMVYIRRTPGRGGVALAALPVGVVLRAGSLMAGQAVAEPGLDMVHLYLRPGSRVVAEDTVALVVSSRADPGVAAFAGRGLAQKTIVAVAGPAGHIGVLPGEREGRRVLEALSRRGDPRHILGSRQAGQIDLRQREQVIDGSRAGLHQLF